jgi:YbgC/YbaW family acyl-CoA thioester hydrolase
MSAEPANPASIVVSRRIGWMDTDAAGIYHWTTVFRLVEEAEAALHTALGLAERTFGAMPRVHVAVDYSRPLRFNDAVDVLIEVIRLGRASVTYRFRVSAGDGVAAEGRVKACFVDGGRPTPWPEEIRELLAGAGPQPS